MCILLPLEAETKSLVPLKFCVPHVALSFGPAGQLVRVTPALPSHGEPAQVELHSLEVKKNPMSQQLQKQLLIGLEHLY